MKNLLKKISAVAMAFTLLGTGSTLAKTSTKPVKTLTAHAAYNHNCWTHKYVSGYGAWQRTSKPAESKWINHRYYYCEEFSRHVYYKCAICGADVFDEIQYKTVKTDITLMFY